MSARDLGLKDVLASVPGAVCIIATRDAQGGPAGLTVTSFTSLSATPPLVLFCIDNNARCFDSIIERKHFSVNVLSMEQKSVASILASKREDKWRDLAYDHGQTGVPLISGCAAYLECERHTLMPGGDHTIVVGHVLHYWRGTLAQPLLYRDRAYWQLQELTELAPTYAAANTKQVSIP
jgi:flavin reductase (DIM6/NTAB) family NADH-FMN oxidoreductase RutF